MIIISIQVDKAYLTSLSVSDAHIFLSPVGNSNILGHLLEIDK